MIRANFPRAAWALKVIHHLGMRRGGSLMKLSFRGLENRACQSPFNAASDTMVRRLLLSLCTCQPKQGLIQNEWTDVTLDLTVPCHPKTPVSHAFVVGYRWVWRSALLSETNALYVFLSELNRVGDSRYAVGASAPEVFLWSNEHLLSDKAQRLSAGFLLCVVEPSTLRPERKESVSSAERGGHTPLARVGRGR